VTSFFRIKSVFCVFSRKQQDGSLLNFFQGLGENTSSLQPALKNNTHGH